MSNFVERRNCIMKFRLTLLMILTICMGGWCENTELNIGELRQMCSYSLKKRDFHKTRELASSLRERSIRDRNDRMLGNADFYLGSAELFLGDSEAGLYHLNEARDIAEKTNNDTLLGKALNCLGIYEANVNSNYYLAQHYLLQSLECYDMEGSASTNLAQIALLQNDTSGMHYARRAYEYGVKSNEVHYSYSALIALAEFAIMKGDLEAASSYLEQSKKIAAEYGYEDTAHIKFLEAKVLALSEEIVKSNSIINEIRPTIESKFPIYLPDLLYLMGDNYNKEGKYTESNAILTEAVRAAESNSSTTSLGKIYRLIADNYSAMGLDNRAIPYMRQAFDFSEKIGQTDRQRMINERKLTLDVIHQEQKRQLAEEKARYTSRLSIFLGLLLLLATTTIIIVITNLRRRNRLYRHIVQQNLEMLDNEERYKARIRDLESLSSRMVENVIPADTPDEEEKKETPGYTMAEEKSKRLFDVLQTLMEEEHLYRNPQLTRETVMEMLKTNSTYLAQAIKDNSGMNYSQYINSFRMREALKALSDRTRIEVPIKDIAVEAGFNSLTTFYKLFQQVTGISPAAYRRSLASMG